jgi:hypothetical protein
VEDFLRSFLWVQRDEWGRFTAAGGLDFGVDFFWACGGHGEKDKTRSDLRLGRLFWL